MDIDIAMSVDGLLYSDNLLTALPVLDDGVYHPNSKRAPDNAAPGCEKEEEEPIRALSAPQFAEFHMQHTLAHPRDSLLFPFLHGLEGDNLAQNTFFASSSLPAPPPQGPSQYGHGPVHGHGAHGQKITPRIPKYRGLVWVVCEDDLEKAGDGVTLRVLRRKPVHGPGDGDELLMSPPSSSSDEFEEEDDEESDESCFEEDFDEDGLSMMVLDVCQPEKKPYELHYEGGHMHPVSHRPPAHLNINIDICPSHHSASSSSEASTSTSTTSTSSSTGSTPNSSIFSPDAIGCPDLIQSPTTTVGSNLTTPVNHASLQQQPQHEEDNCPLTPCALPSPLPPPTTATTTSVQIPVTIESHPDLPPGPLNIDEIDIDFTSIRERSPPRSMRSPKPKHHHLHPRRKVCIDPRNPPLLTSTFRPKELVRKVRAPSASAAAASSDTEKERVKRGLAVHPFRPPPPPPSPAPSSSPSLSTPTLKPTIDDDESHEKTSNGRREDEEASSWTWEFVPAKVPDGISLRNFGIQVPIYATLSDIVIYSPYGATPSALTLARRFREAIKAKRIERMRNAGVDVDLLWEMDDDDDGNVMMENGNEDAYAGIVEPSPSSTSPSSSQESVNTELTRPHPFPFFHRNSNAHHDDPQTQPQPRQTQTPTEISIPAASKADLKAKAREAADGFVQYRVFVLDADEGEMRSTMPHMMMRVCKEREGWQCQSADGSGGVEGKGMMPKGTHRWGHVDSGHGAHTDRSDGHIIELGNVEEEERRKKREESGIGMDVDAVNGEGDKDRNWDAGMDVDVSMPLLQGKEDKDDLNQVLHSTPNTVDFALREKEEMRDLTKASVIVSLLPELPPISLPLRSTVSGSSSATITRVSSATHLGIGNHHQSPMHTNAHPQALFSNPHQHPMSTFPFGPKEPVLSEEDAAPTIGAPAAGANPRLDPRVGQILLGNSGDVPLAPDVPNQFRHAGSECGVGVGVAKKGDLKPLTRHLKGVEGLVKEFLVDNDDEEGGVDCELDAHEEDIDLPHDDPFNYLATNDPEKGFGFDICVECHDLAPFPTAAHMRAAEEHLGMLDIMWKERWEAAWNAREEKRLRKAKDVVGGPSPSEGASSPPSPPRATMKRKLRMTPPPPAPPRPPPHANAVIHLPFPSSPFNTQTTMVALMPVIRFLEKWIRPVPVPVVHPPSPPSPRSRRPSTPPELRNMMPMAGVDSKTVLPAGVAPGNASTNNSAPPPPSSGSGTTSGSRRWSSVSSLLPAFPSFPGVASVVAAASKDQHQPQQQTQLTQVNNNNNGVGSTVAGHNPQLASVTTGPLNMPLSSHPSARTRSLTSPSGQYLPAQVFQPPTPVQARTRPLKVLLYSADGYTESSVPALCLLMSIRGLGLPEAYLELQVEKKRSFFVYQSDLGILRRVEGRLREEREREKERERERERERMAAAANSAAFSNALSGSINANGKRTAPTSHPAPAARTGGGVYWSASSTNNSTNNNLVGGATRPPPGNSGSYMGRPAAKSISFAARPHPPAPSATLSAQFETQHVLDVSRPTQSSTIPPGPGFSPSGKLPHPNESNIQRQFASSSSNPGGPMIKGRPRAITSPWLPSLIGDHQSWFNDPRFDGSFPSRVLPFLYLGNLNHASNVYMLHALGITHVVSVGECALVPPSHHMTPHSTGATGCYLPGAGPQFKGPSGHGSLWLEEREGRIKVMDIKGVCDDGIDTLEPQLEPICDWIDKARQEGGQVLVHCRVGVSRSATVTIAYVMKHLNLPLVDAYLIVRSRRLSVLIQPNMRLLYNLCGWEIKLAKERAKGDQQKLKLELARTLTWPYLAKEVHALNEKYLH